MFIVIGILILVVIFAPQLWCKYVLDKYHKSIEQLPGTGGEFASHLLNLLKINDVKVEMGKPQQDHYDPEAKCVRLSPEYYNGKSLTSVAIAAHEVGHAIQHHTQYKALEYRTRIAKITAVTEKVASIFLISFPLVGALTKLPLVSGLLLLSGLLLMLMPVIFHLATLPVELDASFNRALPMIKHGNYLPESALPVIHRILTAAALTYVAASLASLLNFYRWFAILRR